MARAAIYTLDNQTRLRFLCVGCEIEHHLPLNNFLPGQTMYEWNGDTTNITVTPGTLIENPTPEVNRCHFLLENGDIVYQPDCDHQFAGQRQTLPNL